MWWSRLMSPAQRNDLSSEPEHALCPSSPSRPHSAATPRGRVHRPSGVRVARRAWRNPSRAWFCCGTVPWISTKSLPTKVEDRHDLVPTATVKRQQSHPFSFSCPFNLGPVAHSSCEPGILRPCTLSCNLVTEIRIIMVSKSKLQKRRAAATGVNALTLDG